MPNSNTHTHTPEMEEDEDTEVRGAMKTEEGSERMKIQVFYHLNTTQQPETSVGGCWWVVGWWRKGKGRRERLRDQIRLIERERQK